MSIRLRVVLVYPEAAELPGPPALEDANGSFNRPLETSLSMSMSIPRLSPAPVSNINVDQGYREYKRFLHLTQKGNTLQVACNEIVERYAKLYPEESSIEIEKLQDEFNCDLDPDYIVGDIFTDGSTVIGVMAFNTKQVLPANSSSRASSKRRASEALPEPSRFQKTRSRNSRRSSIWMTNQSGSELQVLPRNGYADANGDATGNDLLYSPRLPPPAQNGHNEYEPTPSSPDLGSSYNREGSELPESVGSDNSNGTIRPNSELDLPPPGHMYATVDPVKSPSPAPADDSIMVLDKDIKLPPRSGGNPVAESTPRAVSLNHSALPELSPEVKPSPISPTRRSSAEVHLGGRTRLVEPRLNFDSPQPAPSKTKVGLPAISPSSVRLVKPAAAPAKKAQKKEVATAADENEEPQSASRAAPKAVKATKAPVAKTTPAKTTPAKTTPAKATPKTAAKAPAKAAVKAPAKAPAKASAANVTRTPVLATPEASVVVEKAPTVSAKAAAKPAPVQATEADEESSSESESESGSGSGSGSESESDDESSDGESSDSADETAVQEPSQLKRTMPATPSKPATGAGNPKTTPSRFVEVDNNPNVTEISAPGPRTRATQAKAAAKTTKTTTKAAPKKAVAAKPAETAKPEAVKPAAKPEAAKPAAKPEAAKPTAAKPETPKPEAVKPAEAPKPTASKPVAKKPVVKPTPKPAAAPLPVSSSESSDSESDSESDGDSDMSVSPEPTKKLRAVNTPASSAVAPAAKAATGTTIAARKQLLQQAAATASTPTQRRQGAPALELPASQPASVTSTPTVPASQPRRVAGLGSLSALVSRSVPDVHELTAGSRARTASQKAAAADPESESSSSSSESSDSSSEESSSGSDSDAPAPGKPKIGAAASKKKRNSGFMGLLKEANR